MNNFTQLPHHHHHWNMLFIFYSPQIYLPLLLLSCFSRATTFTSYVLWYYLLTFTNFSLHKTSLISSFPTSYCQFPMFCERHSHTYLFFCIRSSINSFYYSLPLLLHFSDSSTPYVSLAQLLTPSFPHAPHPFFSVFLPLFCNLIIVHLASYHFISFS